MGGGGQRYEEAATKPPPEDLLLDTRKERIEQVLDRRTRTLCVVLDRLEDTFNMAAVLRTCEAMGVQEVHVIRNPDHPFSPNVKVTQGCDKWLDVVQHESPRACFEALRARKFRILASAVRDDAKSLFELTFDGRLALVFGNERFGVSPEALAGADAAFWIPMLGFTRSLNISAAVSATLTCAIAWRMANGVGPGDLTPDERAALRERFHLLAVKQRGRIYGRKA